MEIIFKPEYIYYPATDDYGGSQKPEPESVELVGVSVIDFDNEGKEYPAVPKDMYHYIMNNFEEELKEFAINDYHDNEGEWDE